MLACHKIYFFAQIQQCESVISLYIVVQVINIEANNGVLWHRQ